MNYAKKPQSGKIGCSDFARLRLFRIILATTSRDYNLLLFRNAFAARGFCRRLRRFHRRLLECLAQDTRGEVGFECVQDIEIDLLALMQEAGHAETSPLVRRHRTRDL